MTTFEALAELFTDLLTGDSQGGNYLRQRLKKYRYESVAIDGSESSINGFEAIQLIAQLRKDAAREVMIASWVTENERDLCIQALNSVDNLFDALSEHNDWSDFVEDVLKSNPIVTLRLAAATIKDRNGVALDSNFIMKTITSFENLLEELPDTGLPADLKQYMLTNITRMLIVLRQIHVFGPQDSDLVANAMIGEMVVRSSTIAKEDRPFLVNLSTTAAQWASYIRDGAGTLKALEYFNDILSKLQ